MKALLHSDFINMKFPKADIDSCGLKAETVDNVTLLKYAMSVE
jgi:hypothetical protein